MPYGNPWGSFAYPPTYNPGYATTTDKRAVTLPNPTMTGDAATEYWKSLGLLNDKGRLDALPKGWQIRENLNTGEKTFTNFETGETKPYTADMVMPPAPWNLLGADPNVPRTPPIVVPTEGLPEPVVVPEGGSVSFPNGTGMKPVEVPKPIVWRNTQASQTPSVPQNIRIPDLSRPSTGPLAGNLFSTINGLQNRTTNRNPFSNPTQPVSGSFYYSRPKVTAGIY